MRDERNNKTECWRLYELGRAYNNRLEPNQYNLVNTNIEFYAGNQWINMKDSPAASRLARPVFNIIKRIVQLFVASLTATNTTISFDSLSYQDGEDINDPHTHAASFATAEVRNLFEKFKMEYRIREALFDGAVTGDYCAHFYWNPDAQPYGGAFGNHKGEIEMELVDGINVMFGNPNTSDVQSQPYILLIGRAPVEQLRAEAERYGAKNQYELDALHPDSEWQWQSGVGGRTELITSDDRNGKALYIYMYTKVTTEEVIKDENGMPEQEFVLDDDGNPVQEKSADGNLLFAPDGTPVYKKQDVKRLVTRVHVTKATRNAVIFEDVDTGLNFYPIAWGVWEKQKNQYHGRALVTGIVPNQIFINSMMAMIFRHLQLQSFPKTIFNADLINEWDNEIGVALGVHNMQPGMSLRDVASTLQPADMSNQIVMCIDRVITYTKDCLGATDAQLGNVRADNTSALMVLQSSAEVPLENVRSGLHEWVEDIGAILLDMMGTYYGTRPVLRDRVMDELVTDGAGVKIDPMTGQMMTTQQTRRVLEDFDFRTLKKLWFNCRVDVGATTYYSEIAMVQTLDNMRREQVIDVIDYLERLPDKLVPRKQDLIEKLKEQQAQMQQQMMQQQSAAQGGPAMGGALDPDKAIANMPNRIQAQYSELPKTAQEAVSGVANRRAN